MIHAYDKLYLDKAQTSLARMLDYAVYELDYSLETFYDLFLRTGIAKRFGSGDYEVIVGMSGVELAYLVLEESGKPAKRKSVRYPFERSNMYWTGWALAYYQWYTSLSFYEITKAVSITRIASMYMPYHEMDIRQFVDHMNELYLKINPDTNLKRLRKAAGLSQNELAKASGVPLRTIQQYEQRRRNINKAQAEYLALMAQALFCDIEALMERVDRTQK